MLSISVLPKNPFLNIFTKDIPRLEKLVRDEIAQMLLVNIKGNFLVPIVPINISLFKRWSINADIK